MDKNTVTSLMNINTQSSEYNGLSFIIQQAIRQQVNTCIVVKVTAVKDGYVDVLPLVTQIDGNGEAVQPTTLYHLPFMRYHGGVCAVILNPVVGDIGLAVFAGKDCSNVVKGTTEPQQPASFRENSMANGYYLGGFLNQDPTTFIELKQNGSINIVANGGVNITGNVVVNGDVTANDISLINHVHSGVESGGSNTGKPQ